MRESTDLLGQLERTLYLQVLVELLWLYVVDSSDQEAQCHIAMLVILSLVSCSELLGLRLTC